MPPPTRHGDITPHGGIPTTTVRLLVLGDSGVGKTMLVRRLVALLGGKCHRSQGTTVGAHIEAAVWPASISSNSSAGGGVPGKSTNPYSRPVVIEFVEVGGNRGFTAAARQPFFAGADGAILVYGDNKTESQKSLVSWFNELVANTCGDGDRSSSIGQTAAALSSSSSPPPLPPLLIVGTTAVASGGLLPSPVGGASSHLSAVPIDTASDGSGRSAATSTYRNPLVAQLEIKLGRRLPWAHRAAKIVDLAFDFVSGLALVVLSFILLGPGRTMFPWAGVPAHAAASHIEARARELTANHAAHQQQQQQPSSPHLAMGSSPGLSTTSARNSTSAFSTSGGGLVSRFRGSGGNASDYGYGPAREAWAGGASTSVAAVFHGEVEGVCISSDRDFAATSEGVFDFVSEVVRSVSPVSSRASNSSNTSNKYH